MGPNCIWLNFVTLFLLNRGIPGISKDRKTRMNAIAEELALGKYDIVCLQEVWSDNDYIHIKRLAHSVLPYSHHFYRYLNQTGKNKNMYVY
jgi:sphingomyelin phosphodiesterase 2